MNRTRGTVGDSRGGRGDEADADRGGVAAPGERRAAAVGEGSAVALTGGDVVARPRSVWTGDDAQLLDWMIPFYLRDRDGVRFTPERIVDVTYGRGRFWRNSRYRSILVGMDLAPSEEGVLARDFAETGLEAGSVDVVVYDPPHVSENATPNASQELRTRQGFGSVEHAADVTGLFPGFMREAWRILRDDGIALCKMADQVHRLRSRWQHVALIRDAEEVGFTVCDMIVKVRKHAIMGRWKQVLHARKVHAFWIVLRKGGC